MPNQHLDNLDRSKRNRFSGVRLERMSEQREDRAWIEAQMQADETLFVPLWRSRSLVETRSDGYAAVFLSRAQIADNTTPDKPTFLGSDRQRSYFAVAISDDRQQRLLDAHPSWRFADLRVAARGMEALSAGILAYAKALHYWQHRHRFCGVCGHSNFLQVAGHKLVCSNDECRRETFPRIDPAIIVLVAHEDACLLGRNPGWPKKRYSTLAGFVEPGESLEDAVVREVYEEAGVRLKSIHYRSSQPWPFPASAMCGFYAEAVNRDLVIGEELEHADWFTVAAIKEHLERDQLRFPPQVSIAFQLLSDWYHKQTGQALSALIDQFRQ